MTAALPCAPRRFPWAARRFCGIAGFAVLIGLGTWQVERLAWKEALLAAIDQRIHAAPRAARRHRDGLRRRPATSTTAGRPSPARSITARSGISSRPMTASPASSSTRRCVLADGRRSLRQSRLRSLRPQGSGDARPRARSTGDGDGQRACRAIRLPKSRRRWCPTTSRPRTSSTGRTCDADGDERRASSGRRLLPFFVDAGPAPNPGGLPVGGVTIIDLPNSHLQYAVTWYGLAAALAGVLGVWLWRRVRSCSQCGRGLDRAGSPDIIFAPLRTNIRTTMLQTARQTSADDPALPAARLLRRRRPRDPDRRAGAEEIRRAGLCPPRDRAQSLRRRRACRSRARSSSRSSTKSRPSTGTARWSFPPMACRNRCRPTRRRAICSISTRPARWSPRCTSRRCATSGSAAMCC